MAKAEGAGHRGRRRALEACWLRSLLACDLGLLPRTLLSSGGGGGLPGRVVRIEEANKCKAFGPVPACLVENGGCDFD